MLQPVPLPSPHFHTLKVWQMLLEHRVINITLGVLMKIQGPILDWLNVLVILKLKNIWRWKIFQMKMLVFNTDRNNYRPCTGQVWYWESQARPCCKLEFVWRLQELHMSSKMVFGDDDWCQVQTPPGGHWSRRTGCRDPCLDGHPSSREVWSGTSPVKDDTRRSPALSWTWPHSDWSGHS